MKTYEVLGCPFTALDLLKTALGVPCGMFAVYVFLVFGLSF